MEGTINFYEILGVNKEATQDEIKKAYRKKAMETHPDRGGKEEDFKKVNEAYQILSDEGKRKQYDEILSRPKQQYTKQEPNYSSNQTYSNPFSNRQSDYDFSNSSFSNEQIESILEMLRNIKQEKTRTSFEDMFKDFGYFDGEDGLMNDNNFETTVSYTTDGNGNKVSYSRITRKFNSDNLFDDNSSQTKTKPRKQNKRNSSTFSTSDGDINQTTNFNYSNYTSYKTNKFDILNIIGTIIKWIFKAFIHILKMIFNLLKKITKIFFTN